VRAAGRALLLLIAAFYAWGGSVHIANIAGLSGFDWRAAPLRWQVLDILYLTIDGVAVWGLVTGRWIGAAAVVLGAASQVLLYGPFRSWILDVPADFAPGPEAQAWLDGLVAFHGASLAALALGLRLAPPRRGRRTRSRAG